MKDEQKINNLHKKILLKFKSVQDKRISMQWRINKEKSVYVIIERKDILAAGNAWVIAESRVYMRSLMSR